MTNFSIVPDRLQGKLAGKLLGPLLLCTLFVAGCSDSDSTQVLPPEVSPTETGPDQTPEPQQPVANPDDGQVQIPGTPDTNTPTDTGAPTDTNTPTDTGAPTDTNTPTDTGTPTDTNTPTDTGAPTDTNTPTDTGAPTDTNTPTDTGAPADTDTPTGTDTPPETVTPTDTGTPPDTNTPPSNTNGDDLSAGDDDSPTATESLSLQGPFIKDPTRGASPPSTPQGLTALLKGQDWVEFSWAPSADDQSVEAYEIYRDGVLAYTVRGDTGFEFDYRSWLSTSYIDCNFTRYTNCVQNKPVPGGSHAYSIIAVDNEGMKSQPSDPVVIGLEPLQSGSINLENYNIIFDENFSGESLDRKLWKTVLPWGVDAVINGEQQYYVNTFGSDPLAYDPFTIVNDTLEITAIATPPELLAAANNLPYLSGVITTRDKFEFTYGYVEMRAKLASGNGLLSTFYLFNQSFEKNRPEIDIVEYIASEPTKVYQTYHYHDSNRAREASGERHSSPTMETDTGVNLSDDFHTYAVLWEPGLAVWYIDDVEVRRLTGVRISDEPMNIITQLVAGSIWIGDPDPASIPAKLTIDYIKAWQKK